MREQVNNLPWKSLTREGQAGQHGRSVGKMAAEQIVKLPVGIESFEKIRTEGFYYVDKTGLIRDLLYNWGEVNLFTRPRRFGKSLNMSMLKSFFEIGCNSSLFKGLEIYKETELCRKYMGKFPVISLSLKGCKADTFSNAKDMLRLIINEETQRIYNNLNISQLTEPQQNTIRRLMEPNMRDADLMNALRALSLLLYQYYGQKVIILIDEYDVPLDKAFESGYYKQMVMLMRNLLEQSLKTNESLYFAVLTGCLRIAKESIFTGLNNFKVLSITNVKYDEYFGFTDKDVKLMLEYYALSNHYDTIKQWYDGYRFGNVSVYCPWDVICYCDDLLTDPQKEPETYWTHTSSNHIVKRFIQKARKPAQREIERLIAGEAVSKTIVEELTYDELETSIDNMWSVLFTTGYLTYKGHPSAGTYDLIIPNLEIHKIFVAQVKEWFKELVYKDRIGLSEFCRSLKEGKAHETEQILNAYLLKTISIRDTFSPISKKENFYHGILLGLLSSEDDWIIRSNMEAGDGYSDIFVEIEDERIGIIIEVKYAENDALETGCEKAMAQIVDLQYTSKLQADGMDTILGYGIACYKKHCKVICKHF